MTINYSIIIPHYNIPDLLMRCLRSIPVREDIQVIVVDDCSPGADRYKEQYPELSRPCLELYSTPIGGSAGRARNVGLDYAKGKWVIFLDADDMLVDGVGKLLDDVVNREEDVLFFNYLSVLSDDISIRGSRTRYQCYFEKYQMNGDENKFRYSHYPAWGKMIRLDLIKSHHIQFSETKYSNDVLFSLLCGYYAKRIGVVDKQMFLITQRQGSLASAIIYKDQMSVEEYKNRTDVEFKVVDFLRRHHVNYTRNHYIRFCNGFYQYYPTDFLFYIANKLHEYPILTLNVLRALFITILKKCIKTVLFH